MINPLLADSALPLFSQIQAEHVEPAIDALLAECRAVVERQLQTKKNYTWELLVEPISNAEDKLNQAWSAVNHLNAVMNSDALRAAYHACLPKLSAYATEMGQNKALFTAYRMLLKSSAFASLNATQQRVIRNTLRDFKLSGVDLSIEQKQRYKEIEQELSMLTSRYEENVLDAINGWTKLITNSDDLKGLPESALAQAKQAAEERELQGWLFTLQFPSYHAVMVYSDNWALRREVYEAYTTLASETGPNGGRWDNSLVMEQILALRHEEANLLGFKNYAELSLFTKMAESTEDVIAFLDDLAAKSWRQARNDVTELREFMQKKYNFNELEPADVAYYSEKMREHHYKLSEEQVKVYFPVERVLSGLFSILQKLFGLTISEVNDIERWHDDVRLFAVHDSDGQLRGQFFIDLYARQHKRNGLWMDSCVGRKKVDGELQIPVAHLVCNFAPPAGGKPALLTHDDVTGLFHECGHVLHHILTQVDCLSVSGISGVEWDAVELPSQFMENWCWEKEALALISGHYETGEPLPDELLEKMLAAKNFHAGMQMTRQLELSLFDLRLHRDYEESKRGRIYEVLEQVRAQVAVITVPKFNRLAHSFSHIFAGGYAAGYYSYKWAEVLSSDAFSLFEENGIFDTDTGLSFMHNILEQGGSQPAMDLYVNFRGRKPTIDALLRHHGISQ